MLEASFVAFRLPPDHRSFNNRLTKRPKLYFVDTGLLRWLLRIRGAEQLAAHAARGAVFENLIVAEALKVRCKSGETVSGDFFKGIANWRSLAGSSARLRRRRELRSPGGGRARLARLGLIPSHRRRAGPDARAQSSGCRPHVPAISQPVPSSVARQ